MIRLLFAIFLLVLTGCSAGRVPFKPGEIPAQQDLSASEIEEGATVYNQLTSKYPVDDSIKNNQRVRKIVARLSDHVSGGFSNPWHTYVLRGDDVVNAAATRGNYIFVWTGLLQKVRDDHELAAVLAHEVSHVIANHVIPTPGEQMNNALVGIADAATEIGLASNGYTLHGADLAGSLVALVLQSAVVNPGSQKLETEADTIGIFLMAKSGYDPTAALDFWERIASDPGASGFNLGFLSTHPSTESRLENIRQHLPHALSVYRQNRNRR